VGAANRPPKLREPKEECVFRGSGCDNDGRKGKDGRNHGRREGVGGLCLLGRNRNGDLAFSAQCSDMSSVARTQREQDKDDETVTPAPWSDLLGRREGDDAGH
jgi:hypothetical protein